MFWTVFLIMTLILSICFLISFVADSEEGMALCFFSWFIGTFIIICTWAWQEDEANIKKASEAENAKVVISEEIAKAYYQGQRDYAEGNIHIRDVKYDHCYHWETSPWTDTNVDSISYKPECAQKKEE